MDLSVKRDTVRINEPVFENTADHPVECDILLPDYCPDIARILKAEASAVVDSKTLETDRLAVGGNLCVKIIYVPDDSSSIRCFTYENAFNHTFDVNGVDRDGMARVKVKVDYVNCRPIGPRRLQIKASLSINAKIWCGREEEFISDCDDERVELRRRQIKASSLIGMTEKPFKMEEELELGYGKSPIAALIRSDANAIVQDFKVINNKIIVKGELLMHTLYLTDLSDNKMEIMEHSVAISQIIELEGVNEECICSVNLNVLNLKVEPFSDSDGENRMLAVQATINAQASASKMQNFTVIADAYCPTYEMDIQMKPIAIEYISDVIKTNETLRMTIEADSSVTSLTDCTVKADIVSTKANGKNLVISGEMTVSAMAADAQGGPICLEKAVPFTLTEEMRGVCENMRSEPEVTVISTSSGLNAGHIDLRVDCMVCAVIYGQYNENVASDMNIIESKPKECRQKTLTLYFADKGEGLWDIAKRYNTSMNAIMNENNLEAETLPERSMLLIPKKHCAKEC
jgi:LysM repeat protein